MYIRQELLHPDPLADVLRQLPLEAGQVSTYVPTQTTDEELRNLRAVPRDPAGEGPLAYRTIIKFVYDYLQQGGTGVLLMGRFPALLLDGRLFKHLILGRHGRAWADWFTCESQMYFFATEASDPERIRDVFDDCQAPTTFGVLASGPIRPLVSPSALARAEFDDVVQRADHVLAGAYDGCSLLIWSRSRAS